MTKRKLEDFSLDKLKKRKNLIITVLTVLVIAVILTVVTLVYLIIAGNTHNLIFISPGLSCILFILLFYNGLKKVNKELNKRSQA